MANDDGPHHLPIRTRQHQKQQPQQTTATTRDITTEWYWHFQQILLPQFRHCHTATAFFVLVLAFVCKRANPFHRSREWQYITNGTHGYTGGGCASFFFTSSATRSWTRMLARNPQPQAILVTKAYVVDASLSCQSSLRSRWRSCCYGPHSPVDMTTVPDVHGINSAESVCFERKRDAAHTLSKKWHFWGKFCLLEAEQSSLYVQDFPVTHR